MQQPTPVIVFLDLLEIQMAYVSSNVVNFRFGMVNSVFVNLEQQGMAHVAPAQPGLNQIF
jgi:hypothetical protein